jgi:hypothetical protein
MTDQAARNQQYEYKTVSKIFVLLSIFNFDDLVISIAIIIIIFEFMVNVEQLNI